MALIQRKKTTTKRRRIELSHFTRRLAEQTRLETKNEVFTLASVGGDGNLKAAVERLREMSSDERRELRQSIQQLDYLLDDVSLELMARRGR